MLLFFVWRPPLCKCKRSTIRVNIIVITIWYCSSLFKCFVCSCRFCSNFALAVTTWRRPCPRWVFQGPADAIPSTVLGKVWLWGRKLGYGRRQEVADVIVNGDIVLDLFSFPKHCAHLRRPPNCFVVRWPREAMHEAHKQEQKNAQIPTPIHNWLLD